MNYRDLFSPPHVALLHDWLAALGSLFVRVEFPHSGESGTSYLIFSLEELKKLVVKQAHPEIEIFIFKSNEELEEDDLDHKLDVGWAYGNPDEVLHIAVTKNRNFYRNYLENPQRYEDVVARWFRGEPDSSNPS